jgi:ribosomal protein L37E
VTTNTGNVTEGGSSLRVIQHVAAYSYTMAAAPSLSYQEIKPLLPLFASSWSDIMSNKTAGCRLADMFHIGVIEGLKRLEEGSIIDMLLRSGTKKHSRAGNPVIFIMRYCIKALHTDEEAHVKKLHQLGHEHSRIGVTDHLIAVFCEVLLQALVRCLVPSDNSSKIIHAWAANFKYIVTHMTNRRFSFLRMGVLKHRTCTRCGEDLVNVDSEICNDCMLDNSSGTRSTSGIMYLNHDGLDHDCYSIPEIGSTDSVTVKYRRERNAYDLFVLRARMASVHNNTDELVHIC